MLMLRFVGMTGDAQGKMVFWVIVVLEAIFVVDMEKTFFVVKIQVAGFTLPALIFFVFVSDLLPVRRIIIYRSCNVSMSRHSRYLSTIFFKKIFQVEIFSDFIPYRARTVSAVIFVI